MASRAGDNRLFNEMISKFFLRDEFKDLPIFTKEKDFAKHLHLFEEKLSDVDVQLSSQQKIKLLFGSLHPDVIYELKSHIDYDDNRTEYAWIKAKLMEICSDKKSKIGVLTQLLKIKQSSGEKVGEFLTKIIITGMKILHNVDDKNEREKLMLSAFVNGLSNPRYTLALNEMKPNSLEEAFKLIKKEYVDEDDNTALMQVTKMSGPENNSLESKVQSIMDEMSHLKRRVCFLEQQNRELSSRLRVDRPRLSQTSIRCYECQGQGHIAKMCPKRNQKVDIKCRSCGLTGHYANQCGKFGKNRGNHQFGKLRNLKFETESNISGGRFSELREENAGDDLLAAEGTEEEQYAFASIQKSKKKLMKPVSRRGDSKLPTEVIEWNAYINNRGRRPKVTLGGRTMISKSCNERAANKPIVHCQIGSVQTSVLLDTGAETNVVDRELMFKIMKDDKKVKFIPGKSRLNCANGSPLPIIGYTTLEVLIGNEVMKLNFCVVEKIFPRLVVGLKGMKKEWIDICPREDCIVVKKRNRVDFISRTEN